MPAFTVVFAAAGAAAAGVAAAGAAAAGQGPSFSCFPPTHLASHAFANCCRRPSALTVAQTGRYSLGQGQAVGGTDGVAAGTSCGPAPLIFLAASGASSLPSWFSSLTTIEAHSPCDRTTAPAHLAEQSFTNVWYVLPPSADAQTGRQIEGQVHIGTGAFPGVGAAAAAACGAAGLVAALLKTQGPLLKFSKPSQRARQGLVKSLPLRWCWGSGGKGYGYC